MYIVHLDVARLETMGNEKLAHPPFSELVCHRMNPCCLAFLEDLGLPLLICSKLMWGECRTGDSTWCSDTELLAVGVTDMTGHIHTKCPEGDRDAQKSGEGVQTPRGQVRLSEKERP